MLQESKSWSYLSPTFNLEIKCWSNVSEFNKPLSILTWNVYAYIFPEHPKFQALTDGEQLVNLIETYRRIEPNRVTLGSDYNHIWNRDMVDFDDAIEVRRDYELLFEKLSSGD